MTGRGDKYGQQPAYNESFVPAGPPSYSEAVGASNPQKSLYPNPPAFPPQYVAQPVPPQPVPPQPPVLITVPVNVGPKPSTITCPHCGSKVTTKTKSISTKSAHLACFLLCIFGCCLCSCIPYCMNAFSAVHHSCPVCKAYIGVYKH